MSHVYVKKKKPTVASTLQDLRYEARCMEDEAGTYRAEAQALLRQAAAETLRGDTVLAEEHTRLAAKKREVAERSTRMAARLESAAVDIEFQQRAGVAAEALGALAAALGGRDRGPAFEATLDKFGRRHERSATAAAAVEATLTTQTAAHASTPHEDAARAELEAMLVVPGGGEDDAAFEEDMLARLAALKGTPTRVPVALKK